MLCNMDVSRFFHLQWQEPVVKDSEVVRPGYHFLIMQSEYSGEFGLVRSRVVAKIDDDFRFHFFFLDTSGESPESLFSFRRLELFYFVSAILPLFNPKTFLKDGPLPFSQEPESSPNP